MSETKFKQITQSLKFFDPHLCFQIINFYSKSKAFSSQPKEFHDKLIKLHEDFLFNRSSLFEQQEKYLNENVGKVEIRSNTVDEEK